MHVRTRKILALMRNMHVEDMHVGDMQLTEIDENWKQWCKIRTNIILSKIVKYAANRMHIAGADCKYNNIIHRKLIKQNYNQNVWRERLQKLPDYSLSPLIRAGWCQEGHPVNKFLFQHSKGKTTAWWQSKKLSLVFDTPQAFDFSKVDSDAALLPSWFNW